MPRKLKNTDRVLVCGDCLTAACWYGEFMCDGSRGAGLKVLIVGDLRKLDREHEDYWSDLKLIKIYGNASREFRV